MSTPTGETPTVRATVRAGRQRPIGLPAEVENRMIKVVVDTHLHLPDMFEITFLDDEGTVADAAGLHIGSVVEIHGGAPTSSAARRLIVGDVTAVEAVCDTMTTYTVVRGYDRSHRLQRGPRTRTFVNMKDSDIARRIAREAGLVLGDIDESRVTHAHLSQMATTDWDFLQQRARAAGFEAGTADGKFFFRRRAGAGVPSIPPGPARRGQGGPVELRFRENLLTFLPRISAAALSPKVEVRSWNPDTTSVVVARATTVNAAVRTGSSDPVELARSLTGAAGVPSASALARQVRPGTAQEPDPEAHVLCGHPSAGGPTAALTAETLAENAAETLGSTSAEAEGHAVGDPRITAGAVVRIDGVPRRFTGDWTVTHARHTFAEDDGGYYTRFYVSGGQERSLPGLASSRPSQPTPSPFNGLVCGVVTNINDPQGVGRVKVTLPWLSPGYESDWARVAQFGAGRRSGALFLPEVGDEVLIGFEMGDSARPFVIGGLINGKTEYGLGGPAVKSAGATGTLVRRGFVSSSGNRLVFTDDVPASGGRASESRLVLGTGTDSLSLSIDQIAGTITLTCDPHQPQSRAKSGTVTVSCGDRGTVNVRSGPGGTVNVDGGSRLNLRADTAITIESGGDVAIKGRTVRVSGNPIKLN
ncbi:phage baseplate assembly protein V [Streptomyces sp. TRM72054]|uniref:phage baseplate assembly protein V n=1 Tax=Streptomyces sp. TRM72054 TaxID=2870562 RepID=UPI001C8C2265|nr:phage baseplate assembly protein V [Streptomyces sp. TRM72054]MBX9394362.1 phage baseplate assembly protein V [Streptomyces sp. TRM72054]